MAGIQKTDMVMLVSYKEILRDPNLFIIEKIVHDSFLLNQFSAFTDVERFVSETLGRVQFKITAREEKNIFKWLATKEFDYEANYKKFYDKYPNMYEDTPAMEMYRVIPRLLSSCSICYIYSKEYDKRIAYDLAKTFGKEKRICYVTGEYLDIVEMMHHIDVFIDNDIDRICPVVEYPQHQGASIYLARYGYNYAISPESPDSVDLRGGFRKLALSKGFYLTEFTPMRLTEEILANG